MRVYLAGPFFNPDQKSWIEKIRSMLLERNYEVFSPMHDGVECPKDATRKMRKDVFDLDASNIDRSDVIVAVLDYKGCDLISRVGDKEYKVSLPDSGTVWEIGYGYSSMVPTIGVLGDNDKFNLMLSESVVLTKIVDLPMVLKEVEELYDDIIHSTVMDIGVATKIFFDTVIHLNVKYGWSGDIE